MPLFPLLLATHVALAIGLILPSLLLPFAFRSTRHGSVRAPAGGSSGSPDEPGRLVGLLLRLQGKSTLVIGAGLAITGIGLLAVLGGRLLEQPWLLVALAIYATTMAIAFFIQRPGLRTLVGLDGGSDDPIWRARARRGRYVSYAMAGLVGTIGFLMSTKPELW
jgi:hypothetical protein